MKYIKERSEQLSEASAVELVVVFLAGLLVGVMVGLSI